MELQKLIGRCLEQPDVHIENFQGPLDVLISLIEKSDISIYDVSIAEITDQYLSYLRQHSASISIEATSEFQLMAAYLIYLKARLLLPRDEEEEKDIKIERQALIELLLQYHRYRKLSELLATRSSTDHVLRKSSLKALPEVQDESLLFTDAMLMNMRNYYLRVLRTKQIYQLQQPSPVHVSDKIQEISILLKTQPQFYFSQLVEKHKIVLETICAFLALLELAKQRLLFLVQEKPWADIQCKRVEK